MNNHTKEIREISYYLLKEGKVQKVIGFGKGTVPMAAVPIAIRSKKDAEKLVFNSVCGLNLANYISRQNGKLAVVAKGCDSRNIVNHIVENQISREQIYIIGVPCSGMIDKAKISSLFHGEILFFEENNDRLIIKSSSEEKILEKKDFIRENCRYCTHRNPVLYDVLAGEPVEEQKHDNIFPDVTKIEKMSPDEKWKFFDDLTENCIRCYACRNACPLCYCPSCFVDESNPQWVGKGQNKTDIHTFHFLRAFHCAGRCTDCGACLDACPMNINVLAFTRKLIKDSLQMFGWEAGLDVKKRPPLDVYSPEDPDNFIK